MASFGYITLVLALAVSAYAGIAYFLEARSRVLPAGFRARNAVFAATGLITLAVGVLLYAILTHNFSFEYVASYSSLHTSPLFLFAAIWTGNSGSLMFWTWLLSIIILIVVLTKQSRHSALLPYAAAVMMATQVFFLLILAAGNHPFGTLSPVPTDGVGLNPMLQNIGMVFHPPALYIGYVGFTVPFAFAVSALLNRRLGNNEWLQTSRRWMIFAWLLLGIGNIIGAWWAYVELGWGGYWAWDPVENAGLMPWLLATAMLHSSIMQRRSSTFKVWNIVLAVLVFNMVIFATFLTRSNILNSLHTFNQSGMEPYFLTFIAIALIGPLALAYYRSNDLKSESGSEAILSRDAAFALNNIIFIGTTALIFIGTLFPLFSQAFTGSNVSLSASFFNQVDSPLLVIIILLAGVCTLIGWRQLSARQFFKETLWPLGITVVLAIGLGVTVVRNVPALLALAVCAFVLLSILFTWAKEARAHGKTTGRNVAASGWDLARSNTQRYGGYIVHIAVILIAIGVIGSSFFGTQAEGTLKVGDSLSLGQYTVTYNGLTTQDTPDTQITSANLTVTNSGHPYADMTAQKIYQKAQQQNVSEVALHSNLAQDLYIILEGWQNNGATADFKVLVNPLVIWIWIGGGVFLLGGIVAFWPARRRLRAVEAEIMRESMSAGAAPVGRRPLAEQTPRNGPSTTRTPGEGKTSAPKGKPGAANRLTDDEIEKQIQQLRQTAGRQCTQCGQKNRAEARFCSRCGTRLPKGKKDA